MDVILCFGQTVGLATSPFQFSFLPSSLISNILIEVAESFTENGWQLRFCHITSMRVERELDTLMDLIDCIILNDEADTWSMRFGS
jgi:hypothetical protein